MPKVSLNYRSKMSLVVIGILTVIYLMVNFITSRLLTGLWGSYLFPSLMWLALAVFVWLFLPKGQPASKNRHRQLFNWAALLCAVAVIGSYYGAGLFSSLGSSPYDHSFKGVLISLLYIGAMLAGMETARAWLINYGFKKRPSIGVVVTAIIFTLFTFIPQRLVSFDSSLDAATFAGNILLPNFTENLLASYLAFLGGIVPALIYRGILLAVQWFAPVLPDLSWLVKAVLGTFVPALCMVMLHQLYRSEVLKIKNRRKDAESPVAWVAVSATSVLIVWFAVGVFSIFPNVIISGSMSPEIEVGDIVLIKRITPEEVQLNDVIMFREDSIRISHRVIDVKEDDRGLPIFITKGDANNSPDSDPVIAEQLLGKVVQIVPKIGWVTILLRGSGQS